MLSYQGSFVEEEMPVPEKPEGRIFPDLESRPGIFYSGCGDQRNSEIVEFVVDFFEVLKDARTFQICGDTIKNFGVKVLGS